jgi:hypothetical protein
MSAPGKAGWLDRGTKYTKSWTKRYVSLERAARRLLYAESSEKPAKGILLMKKITRTAEKNEGLKPPNADLYSFAVDGVDPEGKESTWLLRCADLGSFEEWYLAIRASIAAHGLMDPIHYGLPDRDPRCDLPLITVPVEHLFRFSLLDKAIMYYFGVVQLVRMPLPGEVPPAGSGGLMLADHILVLCDKHNYVFNFSADVIRCFPVAALELIRAGDKCVGLKLQHPQHDVLFRTESPVAIIEILRRTFVVATGQEVEVDSSKSAPEAVAAQMTLRPYDNFQLNVNAPTPKQKLKHALDVYERQTGQAFVYGSAQNPAQQMSKTSVHTADAMDVEDPMAALMMRLKLSQYIVLMQRQHLDLDVLKCMDESDLASFGIADAEHRRILIEAVRGETSSSSDFGRAESLHVAPAGAARAAQAAPPMRARIVLDDDDDMNLVLPSQRKIVLDDDDIVVLPKKSVVLDDSDEDLPIATKAAAPAAASAKPKPAFGDDI